MNHFSTLPFILEEQGFPLGSLNILLASLIYEHVTFYKHVDS